MGVNPRPMGFRFEGKMRNPPFSTRDWGIGWLGRAGWNYQFTRMLGLARQGPY